MIAHILLTAVIFGSLGFTIGFLMKTADNSLKEK